ncbi:hypothetical protein PybrP1_008469 [[Pythium] brassicae (nom. inval.)]|nr:hypothetical protein PybrP1_008469 [[Pythium] brassicae (nom. inval.)]
MSSSSPAAPNDSTNADAAAPVVIEDPEVQKLLAQHTFLEPVTTASGHVRVRCELTGHELLPRADAIEAHVRSKKFVKAKEWYCYDYSAYAPYIVAHRRKPKSLFCNVTGMVLNRIPAEVARHVAGKKYQRLKEHVKITTEDGAKSGAEEAEEDFDANAFEFENAQVLLSDEEDDEADGGDKNKAKKPQSDDDDDDDDDDSDEEEVEVEEDEDEEEGGDSDMAEFYPEEDEDADDGRLDHETLVKLATQKKRKAPTSESRAGAAAATKTQPPQKKAKAAAAPPPRAVSKARMSSKDRRHQKKQAAAKK